MLLSNKVKVKIYFYCFSIYNILVFFNFSNLLIQVWCYSWEINHDPDYWKDPWTFKPERFLDEEGHLVTPDHPNRRRYYTFSTKKKSVKKLI